MTLREARTAVTISVIVVGPEGSYAKNGVLQKLVVIKLSMNISIIGSFYTTDH